MTWHDIYLQTVAHIMEHGQESAPRGMNIREVLHHQLTIPDASECLLVNQVRQLNYKFMLAEFLWIAGGFEQLSYLTPFNKRMAEFSDDGKILAGAYGPRLYGQWDYVLKCLMKDPDTRQAVASIWTPNPARSKDIPCTLNAQFLLRDGYLHSIWTMRSSDLWLGLPYDAFTFSMIQCCLAEELKVNVGSLTMQLGSAHLYEEHFEVAAKMLTTCSHHQYQLVDAGPHSDDISYKICAKCGLDWDKRVLPANDAYPNPKMRGLPSPSQCHAILRPDDRQFQVLSDRTLWELQRYLSMPTKLACLEALLAPKS